MRSPAVLLSFLLLAACADQPEPISENLRCQLGTYRMASGALIDIGLSSADHLRWRTLDGRVGRVALADEAGVWTGTAGWTTQPHPARIHLGECSDALIRVEGISGIDGQGERVAVDAVDIRFQGAGEELAGRLVLPKGDGRVPVVVLVHGSEDYSALDYYFHQRMLPAQGIGVFVYDKRGTGGSTGEYTQDFYLLAGDAAAAHRTALEMAGDRVASSGYFGGSQGGWVAPLAATLSEGDFVIASYGMAEGPLAEDRDEVQLRLREAGYGEEALAKAREVTDITGRLLASDFQDGKEDLVRVRNAYEDEDWFAYIEGGVSWDMVIRPLWQFRIGYFFLSKDTSWEYEPVPALRSIDAPMLWVLAGKDRSAPSAQTRVILTELQGEGRPIDVAFFPDTDHGIVEFTEDEEGERQTIGYAPGYLPLVSDWIRYRRFEAAYEGAELAPRREASDTPSR
ncbi:MAG: alpha/beta hydrolase [Pseudomonadota bacterium]